MRFAGTTFPVPVAPRQQEDDSTVKDKGKNLNNFVKKLNVPGESSRVNVLQIEIDAIDKFLRED